jgi:Ca2+/H+ antiporter
MDVFQPEHVENCQFQNTGPSARSSLRKIGRHTLLLIVMILPIVLLAEQFAKLVDHGIAELKAPPALFDESVCSELC